ncbi:hypothetical protein TSTA_023600 [Talaromyces stipitatus ATCC 10500]|uniref:Uncharacterized protein n=1 Tax=Talaromyces stipitatus (strain ATCC 10500 / CBS 375.48 / QM 6759 / NRRL 1006) TaxID=441959 RepID=B8M625_TALSN|nr:uncharacterized protein TSTA_023600 [Talaromyces stipitatus ATCC 10500]EED19025.1 hypothetical protein TSTA_023600 [Talaromyces stipitatus ATCC 10500]
MAKLCCSHCGILSKAVFSNSHFYYTSSDENRFLAETTSHAKPSSTVPFERDEMFVGREDIIMSIEDAVQEGSGWTSKRAALVGLEGVGDRVYIPCSRICANTWTVWIHASNTTRFEQGYRDIATVAKVPGRDDPKANILQLVNEWLCDDTNGRWSIVLDNTDDIDTFFNTSSKRVPLVDHLPHVSHGSILATSRNQISDSGTEHSGRSWSGDTSEADEY